MSHNSNQRRGFGPGTGWVRETFYATAPLDPDFALSAEEFPTIPDYDSRLILNSTSDRLVLRVSDDDTLVHVIRRVSRDELED